MGNQRDGRFHEYALYLEYGKLYAVIFAHVGFQHHATDQERFQD